MTEKSIAVALVIRGTDVLMVRRRDSAELQWQFPAGEIEPGETPMEAATREVLEETRVDCESIRVVGERTHPITGRRLVYVECSWIDGDPYVGDPDELDRAEWVQRTDVKNRIPSGLAPVVADLLAT